MTNQLKETVQEALQQLNKKGDGSLSKFSQYLANQSNALETLLHGLLNYIDEKDEENNAELTKAGLAILHKGETILNKQQTDELLHSAENVGKKLRDEMINLTVNIDHFKADDNADINKIIDKMIKSMRKSGYSKQ